ncbi:hypothetical protein DICPUDRAFT_49396 [Dictyostelium purpureum]|uniref:valine--tRNA ligase n=1 Tax=Dictyostelium purpureum TaxID=5786 RepID=F0ZTL5_DICPU|nr:uncharacterized protein DICPUDRAFT_49396 [Dictyostelium purpureum]EGC32719.1 hypothetical protein DICPUDRAFT_49396 [Dictyostelium purpureum]|eukprot:XP_003290752.1 hypothetical protein DICPUDRAFT_49396 [Dictyostelium purpureum]
MSDQQPTPEAPKKEIDEETKRKNEEKKKAKEAEKAEKLLKMKEKEAKQAAAKEKELANKAKKEAEKKAKENEEKEKQEAETKKINDYISELLKTPKGSIKNTSNLLPAYHPLAVESVWYDYWLENGYFSPETQMEIQPHVMKDKKFIIVIPPPNVTGSLHLGHALTNSIQDAVVRYRRMKGEVCLWVPGTDHAGIATQVVVEKKLWKDSKITRHDLGREEFIKKVWEWKSEYGTRIQNQLKKMASSYDWKREVFTMDEPRSRAVNTAFIRMFNDGLIFRTTRLVNWSCALKTAISDIEVDFKDLEKHTKLPVPGHDGLYDFGVLFEFAYPVEGTGEHLVVATTRIETMLADTAIAVHPDDERYKHLHGKFAVHPLVDRKIPIITDAILVDKDFGTGVVKITPSHDPNDYETALRHKLEFINLFTDEGIINENGGKFAGMKRFDCRNAVVEALKEKGLYKGMKDNKMRLGICSRSKDIIEPMIKPQWYVKCDEMGAKALNAVKDGDLKIIPETQKITWYRWLESIKDWCVSRQLWWGHRIPAYHVSIKGVRSNPYDTNQWVVGMNQEEARKNATEKFKCSDEDIVSIEQDPDVLDTWFSSGLFPFSVMGWPDQTEDMMNFYPTSLLETGSDILFFWVARMVMMGQQLTGKLPFDTVFLHSMVRDAHGRKMSKSLGNVIDPNDVIKGVSLDGLIEKLYEGNLDPKEVEKASAGVKQDFPNGIAECGTDAMRFALCAYTSQGRDINLDIQRVVAYRNFCNKIWNATRFAHMKLESLFKPSAFDAQELLKDTNAINIWILNAAQRAIKDANEGFDSYDFSKATTAVYNFWLSELCDVYLEMTKSIFSIEEDAPIKQKTKETLYTCIDIGLRLIHPFMPFLSEELYQSLPRRQGDTIPSIMLAPYPIPQPLWESPSIEKEMMECQDVIKSIRSLRSSYNIPTSKKIHTFIHVKDHENLERFNSHAQFIRVLAYASQLEVHISAESRPGCIINIVNENVSILLDVRGSVDFNQEIGRLESKKSLLVKNFDTLQSKTQAPTYEKVPQTIKDNDSTKLKSLEEEITLTNQTIESFKKLNI